MNYRQKKVTGKIGVLILLILTLQGIVFSQEINVKPEKTDKSVRLYVTVYDYLGKYYEGFSAGDFQFLADGKEQKILSFNRKDEPASIGILVDVSGSMERKLDVIIYGLVEFLNNSKTGNEYFLVTFNDEVTNVLDFTQEREKLFEAIQSLSTIKPKKNTKMYDAFDFGYNKLSNAKFDKRVLLLIGDGQDNISDKNFKDIRKAAEKNNILVYSVGIADMRDAGTLEGLQAQTFLEELSKITGGKAFFTRTKAELVEVLQRIAQEFRSQYEFSIELEEESYQKAKKK